MGVFSQTQLIYATNKIRVDGCYCLLLTYPLTVNYSQDTTSVFFAFPAEANRHWTKSESFYRRLPDRSIRYIDF